LEFLPWSGIPDPQAARRIVDRVAEDNLGYVIDTWHFTRAGLDYDALATLPGEQVHFIQVSDALAAVAGEDIMQQTMGFRVAPGEGVVDWPRMISLWEKMGVDCVIGTEMFSDKVKAMPLDTAAQYLYDTLQKPFQ
jgi:sugar phosphate isomerase/epimerase